MSVRSIWESVRPWLDREVFPESPPAPRSSPKRVLIVAAIAVAAVVIQLARLWSAKSLNSLWAEDGYIYLTDAMRWSFLHTVTTPYNGYLQTLPRLVAAVVVRLPVGWFAAAMAISGALVVTASAGMVWCASAGHIAHTSVRGALVAMVLLLPIAGAESLDNATNSIWYLLFASFWVLLWRPARFRAAMVAALFLFVAALSNGGILLFLPVWGLRLLVVRNRRDAVMVAAFAAGVALQLAFSWKYVHLIGEPGSALASAPGQWHWALVPAYLQRIVGGVVTGQWLGSYLWVHLGTVFEVVLAMGLVALVVGAIAKGTGRTRAVVPLMVALSMAVFLFSGYDRWSSAGRGFIWPRGMSTLGSHYLVVPALLLLSALAVQVDARPVAVSPAAWSRLRTVAIGFVLVAALLTFNVSDQVRGSDTWSQGVATGRRSCLHSDLYSAPVAIERYAYLTISMQVPCSRLIGAKLTAGRRPPPPDPHTTMVTPKSGASLSRDASIVATASDNFPITDVEIRLSGPTGTNRLLGTAHSSLYGYVLIWDTKKVPNGAYTLQSVAYDSAGDSSRSEGVPVVVKN